MAFFTPSQPVRLYLQRKKTEEEEKEEGELFFANTDKRKFSANTDKRKFSAKN